MKTGYESGIGAWYDKLAFELACGKGSYPSNNAAYCKALIKHLQLLNVNKVVDLGCGNLQSYKGNIDWSTTGIQYVGYEANHIALKELEKVYPEMRFEQAVLGNIPEPADAIIVKDVLIHWYDEAITTFFDQVFENFRYVIYMHSTTNRGYPTRSKREMYNKLDPSDRIGYKPDSGQVPPEGYTFWPKPNGCYGYKCVPEELLPSDKVIHQENIMGDSMKTFMVFDREK